jgi:hypothetical protein
MLGCRTRVGGRTGVMPAVAAGGEKAVEQVCEACRLLDDWGGARVEGGAAGLSQRRLEWMSLWWRLWAMEKRLVMIFPGVVGGLGGA